MIGDNWDVDNYKTDHESDEHWDLRKKFILAHKDRLPEDELVCMAQVFTNIEFLGCRYPDETMKRVAELAKGVVEEFREKKKNCLKRTFVAASDAASSKVKGERHIPQPIKKTMTTLTNPPTHLIKIGPEQPLPTEVINKLNERLLGRKQKGGLNTWPESIKKLSGPYSEIIVILTPGMNAPCSLNDTVAKNHLELGYDLKVLDDQQVTCEISIKQTKFCEATAIGKAKAKEAACLAALDLLRSQCYSIYKKPPVVETIERSGLISDKSEPSAMDNSIGNKMMRNMGWQGGGLGRSSQGIMEPVKATSGSRGRGLGASEQTEHFNLKPLAFAFLRDWISKPNAPDLSFSQSFTKDERRDLHSVSQALGLTSKSRGKEPQRQLYVSRKFELYLALNELAKNGGETNKYILLQPGQPDPQLDESA